MPEVAIDWLKDGPRKVPTRLIKKTPLQLEDLFDEFWDDRDFLLIEEFQDSSPGHARQIKDFLGLPDEAVESMYAALERWNISPNVATNLDGLMTDAEIQAALLALEAAVRRPPGVVKVEEPGDAGPRLIGLHDRYHGLLVGPCDPDVAEAEADCRLAKVVWIMEERAFDCTYDEWVEHLRDEVRRAAHKDLAHGASPAAQPSSDPLLAAKIERAKTVGLEDGTRIEARDDGWVVMDSFYSYLVNPEDAVWVAGDDEDTPPTVFLSAEAAYRAWERSEETSAARMQRREEALKRLGKKNR
ncbi:MAG: hypothetical protein ACLQNE_23640 [Thermoguttaceae bacterium]